jgi:hypothetical protein
MKLKAIHLFIILLGALLLCSSLGVFMRTEGFKNKDDKDDNDNNNEPYLQEFKIDIESPFHEKSDETKHSEYKQGEYKNDEYKNDEYKNDEYKNHDYKHGDYKQGDYKRSEYKQGEYKDRNKLYHNNNSSTQDFINDLNTMSKQKKHKKNTDDNSDIYDYNSNKYKHHKKSSYIGPAGDTVITDSNYTDSTHTDSNHTHYPVKSYTHKKPKSTSLGIPYSQIPRGNEDLYILKSEVIPPVCPMCPSISACPSKEAPPPCPPCARCPEPAFDCKKVPNYNNTDNSYLPVPVLSDFSQFGM